MFKQVSLKRVFCSFDVTKKAIEQGSFNDRVSARASALVLRSKTYRT